MHGVHRNIIELRIPERREARSWQDRVSALFASTIERVIEKVLDRFDQDHLQLMIERVEVDLGLLDPGGGRNFELQLESALVNAIERAIATGEVKRSRDPATKKNELDAGMRMTSVLEDYLLHGSTPETTDRYLDIKAYIRGRFRDDPVRFLHLLFERFSQKVHSDFLAANAIKRLVQQMGVTEFDRVVKATFNGFIDSWKDFRAYIGAAVGRDVSVSDEVLLRLLGEEFIHRGVAAINSSIDAAVVFVRVLDRVVQLVPNANQLSEDRRDALVKKIFGDKSVPPVQGRLEEKDTMEDGLISEAEVYRGARDARKVTSTENENLYVDFGGIVILWVYLKPFFSEMGLLDGEEFRTAGNQSRAVHYLHYMATGAFPDDENRLGLLKVMCGMDPGETVGMGVGVTQFECSQMDALMANVLKNWSSLKTGSVEALRSAFIQRKAVISKGDSAWIVNIERAGIDILLERLPWPLSNIVLPWNNYLIQVDWV